jgi:hypothetical protein
MEAEDRGVDEVRPEEMLQVAARSLRWWLGFCGAAKGGCGHGLKKKEREEEEDDDDGVMMIMVVVL